MNHLIFFRDLKINKKQLIDLVKDCDKPLVIYNRDLAYVLKEYINKHINQHQLLEWVNMIWFSDLYEYAQSDCDCIVEVMHILEELDEQIEPLSEKAAQYYITVLNNNKVIPFRELEIEANR